MQLTIIDSNEKKWLIEIANEKSAIVKDIKNAIQKKLFISVENQIVSYEGTELNNDQAICNEIGIIDSAVLLVQKKNHPIAAKEEYDVVNPEEVANTIIVMNIPLKDEATINEVLMQIFLQYGPIQRIILQSEQNVRQNAVIVYKEKESANKAIAFDKQSLLGQTVTVVLAKDLKGQPSQLSQTAEEYAKNIGDFLGKGYVIGQKSILPIKKFDQQHKISENVKARSDEVNKKMQELDQKLHISDKFNASVNAARTKANEVDEKLGISKTAQQVHSKAMENEHVAAASKKMGTIFSAFSDFSERTLAEAKKKADALSPTSANAGVSPAQKQI